MCYVHIAYSYSIAYNELYGKGISGNMTKSDNIGNYKSSSSAFTIVELLAVVAVIGILVAITLVAYGGVSQRAHAAALKSDLDQAKQQIQIYRANNKNVLPTSVTDCPSPAKSNICLKASDDSKYTSYASSGSKFTLVETTSDGTTYKITNNSEPVDQTNLPYLSSLTVNGSGSNIGLSPSFSKTAYSYSANSSYDTSSVTITPTADNSQTTIVINNKTVTSGAASGPITLKAGSCNVIQVIAKSTTGSQEYDIAITRASNPSLLSIAGMPTLSPLFSPATANYSGSSLSDSITVTPITEDTGNAQAINVVWGTSSRQVASGTAVPIRLVTGSNVITVIVVSTTGVDSRVYTFAITH
jgi:prepilin-type N-terminal cleavage/methylation domain-containing protein